MQKPSRSPQDEFWLRNLEELLRELFATVYL